MARYLREYAGFVCTECMGMWGVCWGASCGGTLGDFGMSSSFNLSQERDKFLQIFIKKFFF